MRKGKRDPNRATWLYRYFDRRGHLLYVGISFRPLQRYKTAKECVWGRRIFKIELRLFETRKKAERAERKAIRQEFPAFNFIDQDPAIRFRVSSRGIQSTSMWDGDELTVIHGALQ